jgi:hypothetical protein
MVEVVASAVMAILGWETRYGRRSFSGCLPMGSHERNLTWKEVLACPSQSLWLVGRGWCGHADYSIGIQNLHAIYGRRQCDTQSLIREASGSSMALGTL